MLGRTVSSAAMSFIFSSFDMVKIKIKMKIKTKSTSHACALSHIAEHVHGKSSSHAFRSRA